MNDDPEPEGKERTVNRNKQTLGRIMAAACAALCVLFAVLAVRGFTGAGSGKARDAKQGVVFLYQTVYDTEGQAQYSSGTGWMIGEKGKDPEYLITNAHVVEDAYQVSEGTSESFVSGGLQVYFSVAEDDYMVPQIVYFSPIGERDLAILKLPSPTDKRRPLPIRDSGTMREGDTVYAIGYPGVARYNQDYVRLDAEDATFTEGIISKFTNAFSTVGTTIEIDAMINHGNSGGPVVDEFGNAIGVIEIMSQENALKYNENGELEWVPLSNGLFGAYSSHDVINVLDAEHISYALASPGGRGRNLLYAVLAAAALAGAVILLVLFRRKAAVSGGSPRAGRTASDRCGNADAAPVLRGVSGQYEGQTIPLKGMLALGRNPAAANLVFEKDAPGISGAHCTVAYNAAAGVFRVTDSGSTYGTFLDDGTRLVPGQPAALPPGSGFSLANRGTRFLVDLEKT